MSWRAGAGIGDPSQLLGLPTPILAGDLAIVVGRETVEAVDLSSGEQAWSVPRALGPSAPAAVDTDTLVFVEGGGEDGSASGTPSPTPSASPSASLGASTGISAIVGLSLDTQKRMWSVPLTDVSHTGVVISDGMAIVGADDGTLTAVSLDGKVRWTQDVGGHVLAPIAGAGDLAFASVQAEEQGTSAALVALRVPDGSEVWRYQPETPVADLGGPSVDPDGATVYVSGFDASLRAISVTDGTQRWASAVYSPTSGSAPAVTPDAVVVTDQSGTIYALDPSSGAERWRFATNHASAGPPIVTGATVVQPANDGFVSAIAMSTGHEVWRASIADSGVLGIAATSGLLVASVTGTTPGFVGLRTDEAGVIEDVVSPTVADPTALVINWIAAAVPLTVALFLLGRALASTMGSAEFAGPQDDDVVDPWEDVGDDT